MQAAPAAVAAEAEELAAAESRALQTGERASFAQHGASLGKGEK